jgi:transcriptional regulator with XRE-family HTH domain
MPAHSSHDDAAMGDIAADLATNLAALMASTVDLRTQASVGKRAGVDQRTVGRILNREHSPNLLQIQKLAAAFGLQPWQLLVPHLDPANPPVVHLTQAERELYARVRRAARQLSGLPNDKS